MKSETKTKNGFINLFYHRFLTNRKLFEASAVDFARWSGIVDESGRFVSIDQAEKVPIRPADPPFHPKKEQLDDDNRVHRDVSVVSVKPASLISDPIKIYPLFDRPEWIRPSHPLVQIHLITEEIFLLLMFAHHTPPEHGKTPVVFNENLHQNEDLWIWATAPQDLTSSGWSLVQGYDVFHR